MTTTKLPELPEPDIEVSGAYGYTADQMMAIGCPKCGDVKYHPWYKASATGM